MSPGQRGTLIAVPLTVVAAFVFLMVQERASSYVPLSWGKEFSSDELPNAERTLADAGFNDFRRDGRRILVPRAEVEKYNAALLEGGTLPADWASELEQQLQQNSLFTTDRQLQMRKDIALAKAFRRIIQAVPDVEDGNLVFDRPDARSQGLGHNGTVTATVSIRPRPGREVSMRLVQSLKQAVANMISGLEPEHVAVFDQISKTTYTGDDGSASDSRLLNRIRQYEQMYQERIAGALSWIPGVVVSVNVDLESSPYLLAGDRSDNNPSDPPPPRSYGPPWERHRDANRGSLAEHGNQELRSTGDEGPRSVQVSVAIPEDYYRNIALTRGLAEGTTEEEKRRFASTLPAIADDVKHSVQTTVLKHIPPGSPPDAVTITSYVALDQPTPAINHRPTNTTGRTLIRWGSTAGLTLFALWALVTLNNSTRKRPVPEETQPASPAALRRPSDGKPAAEPTAGSPSGVAMSAERDQLRSIVRDNPERAVAVLSRWIRGTP